MLQSSDSRDGLAVSWLRAGDAPSHSGALFLPDAVDEPLSGKDKGH